MQPWGRDGDKRRYWLIEGQDDTHFRLYRESNPILRHNTWRSVAGSIDEVKEVADRLGEESSLLSRRLRDRIIAAIPRFEASEEVCSPYVTCGRRSASNPSNRNEDVEITVWPERLNSRVQNLDFPSTKAAPVGSV